MTHDTAMLSCQTPIPSKGKQRLGAVSYGKQSIEVQTAVIGVPDRHRTGTARDIASPATLLLLPPLQIILQ